MNLPVRSHVNECGDCGNEFLSGPECPSCGSSNVYEVELSGESVSVSLPGSSRLRTALASESSSLPTRGTQLAFGFGGQSVHPTKPSSKADSKAQASSLPADVKKAPSLLKTGGVSEDVPAIPPKAAVVSVQTASVQSDDGDVSVNQISSTPLRVTDDSFAEGEDPFLSVEIVETGPSIVEVSHDDEDVVESLDLETLPRLPPPTLLESVMNDREHASAMGDIIGLLESGRSSEAASILIPWAKKHPSDPRTLSALGIALLEDGKKQALGNDLRERRFEQAERTMRRCAELRSSDARTLVNLAYVYEATEDHLREEKVWQTVLRIDPEHAVAHLGLARLAVRIGDHSRAIESLKEYQRIGGR